MRHPRIACNVCNGMADPGIDLREEDKTLESSIVSIRKRRVILDAVLAGMYGVTTKALNQAVKRNQDRFPEDFAFRLSDAEFLAFRLVRAQAHEHIEKIGNRSQIVTGSQKYRDPRSRPLAFIEHGALMAANIIRSERAVRMSIYVIRAFVRLRERAASSAEVLRRLAEIDSMLLEQDSALRDIYRKLGPLLQPPPDPPRRRIGFHVDDE